MILNDKIAKQYNTIASITSKYNCKIEGNFYCKDSANNIIIERTNKKIHNLCYLVLNKKDICEVGFNAGHSLLLMLNANSNARYVIFDIGHHPYTRECYDFVKSEYPKTEIQMFYGDSLTEVPKYFTRTQNKFDFIHIDGGHGDKEVKGDYKNCGEMLKTNGIVLFDDTHVKRINKFLTKKIIDEEIEEILDPNLIPTNLHLAFKKNKEC